MAKDKLNYSEKFYRALATKAGLAITIIGIFALGFACRGFFIDRQHALELTRIESSNSKEIFNLNTEIFNLNAEIQQLKYQIQIQSQEYKRLSNLKDSVYE